MTNANIERAHNEADLVLQECSILDAPVPVESIAESYGLKVLFGSLSDGTVSGLLDITRRRIIVSMDDAPARQAFTIAHEIGHFRMHLDIISETPDIGIVYRRPIGGETDPIEIEANAFAAALLVPEKFLSKHFNYEVDDSTLANLFGVSAEVIRYRLRDTGRK